MKLLSRVAAFGSAVLPILAFVAARYVAPRYPLVWLGIPAAGFFVVPEIAKWSRPSMGSGVLAWVCGPAVCLADDSAVGVAVDRGRCRGAEVVRGHVCCAQRCVLRPRCVAEDGSAGQGRCPVTRSAVRRAPAHRRRWRVRSIDGSTLQLAGRGRYISGEHTALVPTGAVRIDKDTVSTFTRLRLVMPDDPYDLELAMSGADALRVIGVAHLVIEPLEAG
jgi:hypothetical protein